MVVYRSKASLRAAPKQFWITNISNRTVSLRDLGVAISPMSSVNLLDKRHYSITEIQLQASQTTGSLYNKSDKIIVRQYAPGVKPQTFMSIDRKATIPSKQRSAVKIEVPHYEELNLSDDDFAKENSELEQQDHLGKWNKDK